MRVRDLRGSYGYQTPDEVSYQKINRNKTLQWLGQLFMGQFILASSGPESMQSKIFPQNHFKWHVHLGNCNQISHEVRFSSSRE